MRNAWPGCSPIIYAAFVPGRLCTTATTRREVIRAEKRKPPDFHVVRRHIEMSTDLGPVNVIGADAVGGPGQRRFRLYAQAGTRSVIMWMEKEQLTRLSLALDRAMAQITDGHLLRTI